MLNFLSNRPLDSAPSMRIEALFSRVEKPALRDGEGDLRLLFVPLESTFETGFLVKFFLPLRDQIQQIEELGKADVRRFRALDQSVSLGTKRRHTEGHGNAVIRA